MNPKITYAITVCNEHWQLQSLLQKLYPYLQSNDQVLIQSDSENVTDDVLSTINNFSTQYRSSEFKIKHVSIPLDKNFGKFKNNLAVHATGDWIFQIDADEYPTESLLTSLLFVLNENAHVDVILVPRINTVKGITQKHITKWGWKYAILDHPLLKVSESIEYLDSDNLEFLKASGAVYNGDEHSIQYHSPVINFPDYQCRIYKNSPEIKWVNKVHEKLEGFKVFAPLPADIPWCLMHEKEITRQETQNALYDTILDE